MKTLLLSLCTSIIFFSCKKEEAGLPEQIILSDTTANNLPAEPLTVYIYSATASPTDNESITLKNNTGAGADISAWTLGDKNNSTAYTIPANTILTQGELKTFTHTTLGFQINDSGEILYLKNSAGEVVGTWVN